MAKRSRGSTSRPGQRPPLQRSASRPASRRPTSSATPAGGATPAPAPSEPRGGDLTAAEEARAAQLEAAIVAQEREAESATRRQRSLRANPAESPRPASGLAVSAAEEYQYVARDVRRISIVGGAMVAILLGLWVVSHAIGIGGL